MTAAAVISLRLFIVEHLSKVSAPMPNYLGGAMVCRRGIWCQEQQKLGDAAACRSAAARSCDEIPIVSSHDPKFHPDRVTLARIADESGVSLSTISKVLNGRPDVSPTPARRIEALLDTHGYRRRGTGTGTRTRLVELVFHELESGVVDGDHPWRRRHRHRARHERGAHPERQPPLPRPRLDRGRAAPASGRRGAGLLRPRRPSTGRRCARGRSRS